MSENWTNLVVDSQLLNTFQRCPREFKFRFVDHLVPLIGVGKNFDKGTLAHKGLQVYYETMKNGLDSTTGKTLGLRAMQTLAPTLNLDAEDALLVYRTFEEYCEYRKNDVFQVVFTEKVFHYIAYESFPLRIVLTGRIDLGVIEASGSSQAIPYDHKSESEAWHYSMLNNQFMIYAIAQETTRLVVNRFGFQKSLKAEKKFARVDINFDPDQLDEFKNESLPHYAREIMLCMERGYFPPNNSSCHKGHFGCIFSDKFNGGICNVSREYRERKLGMYFKEEEWSPENE